MILELLFCYQYYKDQYLFVCLSVNTELWNYWMKSLIYKKRVTWLASGPGKIWMFCFFSAHSLRSWSLMLVTWHVLFIKLLHSTLWARKLLPECARMALQMRRIRCSRDLRCIFWLTSFSCATVFHSALRQASHKDLKKTRIFMFGLLLCIF